MALAKFKNIDTLSESYVPNSFLFRDEEIKKIKQLAFRMFPGIPPSHMLVYGNSGTGKTAIIQKIASEFKHPNAEVFYINVGRTKTPLKAENKIRNTIKERYPKPNLAYSEEDVTDIFYHLHKDYTILILDEIDKILKKEEDSYMLYGLLRPHECLSDWSKLNKRVSLLCISNNILIRELFTQPIQSSFGPLWVKFYPYSQQHLYSIIKHRARLALNKQYIDNNVLTSIAKMAEPLGDARYALNILQLTVTHTPDKQITQGDCEWAVEQIEISELMKEFQTLSPDGILLLYIIASLSSKGQVLFPTVFEVYTSTCEHVNRKTITYRHANRLLEASSVSGLLSITQQHALSGKPLSYTFRAPTLLVSNALKTELLNINDLKYVLPIIQQCIDATCKPLSEYVSNNHINDP